MGFETIVRPYQTGDYAPSATEADPGFTESAAPVRIRPGLVGRGKTYQAHFSSNTSVYVIRRPKETQTGGGSSGSDTGYNPDLPGTNTNPGGSQDYTG